MLPTPNASEPGWKNLMPVPGGDTPNHPNQRWYDSKTGRLLLKGVAQAIAYLPTPTATEATAGAIIGQNNTFKTTKNGTWRRHRKTGNNCNLSLGREIQFLPTPKASDGQHPGVKSRKHGQTLHLSAAVMPSATLMDSDCQTQGKALQPKDNSANKPAKSKLNPEFVEAMMGFPPNWTQVEEPSKPMATLVVIEDSSGQDHLMRHVNLTEWLPRATDTDKIPHRRQRLEALGNAVVPIQAAVAWKRLAQLISSNLDAENADSVSALP